jgi:hypothetical protein
VLACKAKSKVKARRWRACCCCKNQADSKSKQLDEKLRPDQIEKADTQGVDNHELARLSALSFIIAANVSFAFDCAAPAS